MQPLGHKTRIKLNYWYDYAEVLRAINRQYADLKPVL